MPEGEGVAARPRLARRLPRRGTRQVVEIIGQGGSAASGHIPFTPGQEGARALAPRGVAARPQLHRHRAHPPRPHPRGRRSGRAGAREARCEPRRRCAARLETLPETSRTSRRCAATYETEGLDRTDLADDPIVQFQRWYDDAAIAGLEEPNAMTLATVDEHGQPDRARRAAPRRRRTRLRVVHEPQQPQRARARGEPARRAGVPLGALAPPGPRDRHGDADRRRGVGRVLRHAVHVRVRSARGRRCRARCSTTEPTLDHAVAEIEERYRGHRRAAATALGRVPPRARDARGVAGPRQPAARPVPLHSRDGDAWSDRPASGPRPRYVRGGRRARRSARRCAARVPVPPSPSRSGCALAQRGGSSSCTPPPRRAGSLGSRGAARASAERDLVEVGGDRVVGQRRAQVRTRRGRRACGSGRRRAASSTCLRARTRARSRRRPRDRGTSASACECSGRTSVDGMCHRKPGGLEDGVETTRPPAPRLRSATTSVTSSSEPPWYAMKPNVERSSTISSTPG